MRAHVLLRLGLVTALVAGALLTGASPAGVPRGDDRFLAQVAATPETTTTTAAATTTTGVPETTSSSAPPATMAAPPPVAPAPPPVAPAPPPAGDPPVGRAPAPAADLALPALTPPPARDLSAYRGLGTWVDAYDFSPQYQPEGRPPTIVPEDVDRMAAEGIRTIYLQAAKDDVRSPGLLVNPEIIGPMLVRAHARGVKVVAWYLPKFYDLDSDMRRLEAMRDFRWDGHGFDGIGLDIEWRRDVPDHAERNVRLIELSRRLRVAMGDAAVSAIPLPPVLIETVNPAYWPDFPWREIAPFYDVWLPMGYWTFRTERSGYKDGYRYTEENIRRMRANLGLPDAPVHPIGGTDNRSTDEDYHGFVRAAAEQRCLGGSIYDWNTTPAHAWGILRGVPR